MINERLGEYTQHEINNWKGSKHIVICTNKNNLLSLVKEALDNPDSRKKIYLGTILQKTADIYVSQVGIDILGYNVAIQQNEIRKIFKQHGQEERERKRNQRAVKVADFVDCIDVLTNPDSIEMSGKKYRGVDTVIVKKEITTDVTVVALISKGKRELRVQTMYIAYPVG